MARKQRHRNTRRPAPGLGRLGRVARAARSQLRRYPRAILDSVGSDGVVVRDPAAMKHLPDLAPHGLAAVWLGHSTTLLRIGGVTVMTDPVLSDRIGPSIGGRTLGILRYAPTPFTPDRLPPIDLVLVSHAHFDHLDKPTLRAIASERTTVLTARHTARLIPRGFGRVIELDWTDQFRLGGVTVSALRPAHWGARTALDRKRGYNAYVLRDDAPGGAANAGPNGVLFAGDTAMTEAFNRVRGIRLAIFGIGAYEDWEHAHATPEETWAMFSAIGGASPAAHLLPVHHSTFPIGNEPMDEPMARLLAASGTESHRVIRAAPGDLWAS